MKGRRKSNIEKEVKSEEELPEEVAEGDVKKIKLVSTHDETGDIEIEENLISVTKDEDVPLMPSEVENTECGDNINNLETNPPIPSFVPKEKRLACFVTKCEFVAPTSIMLLVHVLHNHKSTRRFNCMHCPKKFNSPLVGLVNHLSMHEDSMFQCIYCPYFHFSMITINKHVEDKHAGSKMEVKTLRESTEKDTGSAEVRNGEGMGVQGKKRISPERLEALKEEMSKSWQCGMCEYYSSNKIFNHAKTSHKIKYQFRCTICLTRIPNRLYISTHCSICHPGIEVTLVAYFYQVETSLPVKGVNVILPDGQKILSLDSPKFVHKKPGVPLPQYVDGNYNEKDQGLEGDKNTDNLKQQKQDIESGIIEKMVPDTVGNKTNTISLAKKLPSSKKSGNNDECEIID